MTAVTYAVVYLVAGLIIAVMLKLRGAATRDVTLSVLIWPVMVPTALSAAPGRPAAATTLRNAARAVENAWGEGRFGDSRELGAVRAFVARLSDTEAQIDQISTVLRGSALTVGDKLGSVKSMREHELAEGIRLLEDLAGQLVLLRFARGSDRVDADRRRIEEVLARIEALAELSSGDSGAMDKTLPKC